LLSPHGFCRCDQPLRCLLKHLYVWTECIKECIIVLLVPLISSQIWCSLENRGKVTGIVLHAMISSRGIREYPIHCSINIFFSFGLRTATVATFDQGSTTWNNEVAPGCKFDKTLNRYRCQVVDGGETWYMFIVGAIERFLFMNASTSASVTFFLCWMRYKKMAFQSGGGRDNWPPGIRQQTFAVRLCILLWAAQLTAHQPGIPRDTIQCVVCECM